MTAENHTKMKGSGRVEQPDKAGSSKLVSCQDRKKEASMPLYLARYE